MTANRVREIMEQDAVEYFDDNGITDAILEHIFDRVYFHIVDSRQEANRLANIGRILGYSAMPMENTEKQGTYKVRFEW